MFTAGSGHRRYRIFSDANHETVIRRGESVAWKAADYVRFYKDSGKLIKVIEGSMLRIDIKF